MRQTVHHVTSAVLTALALTLASCAVIDVGDDRDEGSGDVATDVREVGDFDRLVLAGQGLVLLGAGVDGEIEIETDDNLLDSIVIDLSGDTLTIRTRARLTIDPTDGVTYRLGCPALIGVELRGAGDIELDGCTTTDQLSLELAGAGRIEAPDLDVAELRVALPGAGEIEADGVADRLDVELSGAASFDGGDLRATEATVESSGVGAATLWVTDELDAELSGVGAIRYYGEPSVTEDVRGVGTIESLGPKLQ